ncbi:MAG: phosphoribosylanthranilate isomerase [Propionibacteriaceae bacterium]|nr:phosphoribosylanthranilate isomerase [Propionibacteriaceae bacterium]
MITQIYSIQSVTEALACAEAGADCIGIACATDAGLPAEIPLELGREVFAALEGKATRVALTVAASPIPVYQLIRELLPDVIHLCGYDYMATPEFVAEAKRIHPGIKVLQAIGVTGPEAIAEAITYGAWCDQLILDSVDPAINGVGAAGFTNDWDVCAEIVRRTPCPVILAGGLGPDNVAAAIEQVRPYGVDSFTRTSRKLPDGRSEKDAEKVVGFVRNAKAAAARLGL